MLFDGGFANCIRPQNAVADINLLTSNNWQSIGFKFVGRREDKWNG